MNPYQGLSPAEIRRNLEHDADLIEEGSYFLKLSDDDLNEVRSNCTTLAIEIRTKETKFEEIKKIHKEEMKPLAANFNIMLDTIRSGGTVVDGRLYCIKDLDEDMVTFYNENGEKISSRKLMPSERETPNTFKFNKAVGDGK